MSAATAPRVSRGVWKPDILGPRFSSLTLDLGPDPDGETAVAATVVRHDENPAQPRAVALFVHGMSDYFFQSHLAEHLAGEGVGLYAVDLRKCGRSRRPGQTPHYSSDFAMYDTELDEALAIVAEEHPGVPVVPIAHSTGGVIVPNWLARRRDRGALAPVVALVLDSPWLQLDVDSRVRPLADAVIAVGGRTRPAISLPLPGSELYAKSIHRAAGGDFDFDTELKPYGGVGVRVGWLRAVRRAQRTLQRGLALPLPVLVLRSTASDRATINRNVDTDLILDVESMRRYAPCISDDLTDAPLAGARHDVFLSRRDVLEEAYARLDAWLDDHLPATTEGDA